MLSENFIPTRTPQATELVTGTHELIAELQERLRAGESFDNPKLTEIADKSFGGTRAQGKYTSRDAYDARSCGQQISRHPGARANADGGN